MNKKKSILFKIWQFPRLSETFITAQIITAIKCGYDVSILVGEVLDFEASKQEGLLVKYNIPQRIIIEDFKIPKNKFLRLLGVINLVPSLVLNYRCFLSYLREQNKFSISWFYRFNFYSRFRNYDIIHIQYGTNSRPFDYFKKSGFYKSKLIVSFHGHDAFFPINGWIKNEGYYNDLFKYGDIMVANTPYLAEKIHELGCPSEKIHVVPVGVDTEFFKRDNPKVNPSKPFRIINVGRLDKVKGHMYTIQVIKILSDRGHKVHLTIVGEGQERNALEKLIGKLQLNTEITLAGKKSQEEVKNYLLESDLYILTAVPVQNDRRETQGLATIEAQACGLPVIAFDSGGVKYTILDNKTGFLVPEFDIVSFVERIERLLENRNIRHKFSENAVQYIYENYSGNILIEKWKNLYSKSP